MANELEKQFFDTFGIEPKYEDACTVEDKYWNNEELANEYGTFDQYMNCKCGDQENCTTECSCAYQREVYPQITDSILLELILIIMHHEDLFGYPNNIGELKDNTLKQLIETYNKFSTCVTYDSEYQQMAMDIKHQVRRLFEEV